MTAYFNKAFAIHLSICIWVGYSFYSFHFYSALLLTIFFSVPQSSLSLSACMSVCVHVSSKYAIPRIVFIFYSICILVMFYTQSHILLYPSFCFCFYFVCCRCRHRRTTLLLLFYFNYANYLINLYELWSRTSLIFLYGRCYLYTSIMYGVCVPFRGRYPSMSKNNSSFIIV